MLYRDGKIFDLGTLAGGNESAATCINDQDMVIGFAGDNTLDPYSFSGWLTQTHAFRWTRSEGMQDLGTLGGPDAIPFNVDNAGRISGFSYVNNIPNQTTGVPTLDPFLWENGTMIDLGGLGGTASDLLFEGGNANSLGQVVGNSDLPGDVYFHPFVWTKPGPMQDLGTLGGNYGSANSIDDTGAIAGWANTAGDQNAFAVLWKDQTMTNLGSVDGDPCSFGFFLRNGQVVGSSGDCNNDLHAFLWEHGSIVDLNTLVSPGLGAELVYADYINDRGEITAAGTLTNGDSHAFLLIPCDENHPGLEGCDYSLVEASAAVAQPSAAIRNATSRTPQSLLHRMSRYHFPGRAFGARN